MGLISRKNRILVFLGFLGFYSSCLGEVKILYTAALIEQQYEMRKEEYLHSLQILQRGGYFPYLIEACRESSFFDELPFPIIYTKTNDCSLRNKGVNEARLLQEGLKQYKFSEDSLIVKLTGRYFFTNLSFLNLVEAHPEIDAFVRSANLENTSCFTGCYALRCKWFLLFLQELDLEQMERKSINIEDELWHFLCRHPEIKSIKVESLGLTANIFGTGHCKLTHW